MLHWRDRPDLSNTEVYHTNKEVGEKVCIGSNRQQHIGWDGTTILELRKQPQNTYVILHICIQQE